MSLNNLDEAQKTVFSQLFPLNTFGAKFQESISYLYLSKQSHLFIILICLFDKTNYFPLFATVIPSINLILLALNLIHRKHFLFC